MSDTCNWFRDSCFSLDTDSYFLSLNKYNTECGIEILVTKPHTKSLKKSWYVFCPNCSYPIILKKSSKIIRL